MNIDKILTFFVPKDKKFFTLFAEASGNLVEISKVFRELVNTTPRSTRNELTMKIEDLEHKGDLITHKIFTELSINFITPFDREDIHYLATSLDDIADFIHGSAKRFELYKIEEFSVPMKELADIIEQSAIEVNVAVVNMKSMDNIIRIHEALIKINSLENHADDVFDGAIAALFEEEKDPIKLIKLKEILSNMETATDKCEDVANVIESIIIKNS